LIHVKNPFMLVKPFVLVLLRVVVGLLPHDGGPPLQIEPAAGRNQPRAALGKVPMKETDGPWPDYIYTRIYI